MNEYLKNLGKVSVTGEGEWSNIKEFERLSVVYKVNSDKTVESFLSRKFVPSGIDIYNKEYWQPLALTLKSSGSDSGGGDTPTPTPTPDTYYTINVTTNIATGVIRINGVQKNSGSYLAGTTLTIIVTDSEGKYNQKTVTRTVTKNETINVNFSADDIINVEEYFYVTINSINVNDSNIVIKLGGNVVTVGNSYRVLKGQTTEVTAVDPNGRYQSYSSGIIDRDTTVNIIMIPVADVSVQFEMLAKNWTYDSGRNVVNCMTLFKITGYTFEEGYSGQIQENLAQYCPFEISSINYGQVGIYSKEIAVSAPLFLYTKNQLDSEQRSFAYACRSVDNNAIILYHTYPVATSTDLPINITNILKSNQKSFNISFTLPGVGTTAQQIPVYLNSVKNNGTIISDLSDFNIRIISINGTNKDINLKSYNSVNPYLVSQGDTLLIDLTTSNNSVYESTQVSVRVTTVGDGVIDINVTRKESPSVQTVTFKLSSIKNNIDPNESIDINLLYPKISTINNVSVGNDYPLYVNNQFVEYTLEKGSTIVITTNGTNTYDAYTETIQLNANMTKELIVNKKILQQNKIYLASVIDKYSKQVLTQGVDYDTIVLEKYGNKTVPKVNLVNTSQVSPFDLNTISNPENNLAVIRVRKSGNTSRYLQTFSSGEEGYYGEQRITMAIERTGDITPITIELSRYQIEIYMEEGGEE